MGFGSESTVFSGFCWVFCCFFFLCLVQKSGIQAAIDPVEGQALNSIFQEWGVSADANIWNFSGEPCSGAAIDSTDIQNPNFNPGIKCSCSSDNGTTCHIIRMKVYAMSITGTIPEAIVNLTQMMDLNLGQNYLTGPLPSYIGNLTAMQYLGVGINLFSGTVPKELGNLRKLVSLSISSNNFSGPLPAELGNLTNLQQLYIDSAGVSGEIPSTFAKLQNLQILGASDNAFTGMIPNFFGTLTNLTTLRFEGNSFEGPIPSNLANLIKLTDLRISDLSNGSSSLSFIKDMKALSILVLRNNMISDTLPSNIVDYQSLAHLDLSFNNIKGGLPNSLFNLTSLSYLFLGNNFLSGSLPSNKSSRLLNVDLSYNGLSGSFPSWINEQNLQLNLLGNSFVIDSSNSSALPSGLNCLQRNFPCNRASPRYSEFAIKCGGPVLTSSSGVTFDSENEILGPTSYYMIDTERWAVSNAGRFVDAKNATYTRNSSSQFENTLDTKLFQTTRVSPGSLRYFGLGLENGNYTVNLHFAETEFPDTHSWESLGRRVFNIYIQGNLVWKDFDIRKEAGGKSLTAVVKNAQAAVSENYLEIHLFWAGKGTCCIPLQGSYGPLISAISVTPDFIPTVSNRPPTTTSKKNRIGLIVGVAIAAGVIGFIAGLAILVLRQGRKRWNLESDEEFMSMGTKPNIFSYSELRTATEDFNPAKKLGEGGFGPVYKGTLLSDGRIVAVKQLSVASHQGRSQFFTEIATISAVQHRNLVKLYGCCIESDKRLLVYEYLENRSLDQALFGKDKMNLNWATRFDICLGTARGLAYLHEESSVRIVHRDVKASNILLDGDLTPKISDFGLAKLYDDKKTHISTRVAGTIGYLAPEYAMRGHLTEKADVFGFGVVSLEILSGRPNSDTNLDTEQIYLLEWAWHLHEKNCELELVDQTLDEFDEAEAIRLIGIALLCTQASPMLRPSMSRVVAMLSGDREVTAVTTRPGYLADWQFKDIGSFVSEDASKTSFTGTTTSKLNTSSTGMGASANHLPVYVGQPLLEDVIGEEGDLSPS